MLIFYFKTGCPYCAKVVDKLSELRLNYFVKNRDAPGIIDELIIRGGKRQFPYMVDEEAKVEMYESEDIADYLESKYGKNRKEKTRTILKENAAAVCEV